MSVTHVGCHRGVTIVEETGYDEEVNTVIDSGATDHCFVRRDVFADYVAFTKPISGRTVWEG